MQVLLIHNKFEDYKLIKKLVKDNRTFSIGLDPYKALVSDIKVTGELSDTLPSYL